MKPKAFISSTCYDIPETLDAVIELMEKFGYEAVHSKKWKVPRGHHTHDICIKKVEELDPKEDVYVLLVTKRYGGPYSGSEFINFLESIWSKYLQGSKKGLAKYRGEREKIKAKDISITWAETMMAYSKGLYVLPFVDAKVENERATYKKNPGIRPAHAASPLTFHFLDYICYQDKNNWWETFSNGEDLKKKLEKRIDVIEFPPKEYKGIFRYTFKDYPDILFSENSFDLAIVFPAGEREKNALIDNRDKDIFTSQKMHIKLRGKDYSFERTVRNGASVDALRIGDLLIYLLNGYYEKKKKIPPLSLETPICYMETAIPEAELAKNIFVVGGGDTNSFRCVVSTAFQKKYGRPIPIRFFAEEKFIFESENIYSELSGKTYQEQAGTEHYHCGSVVMIPNPWNEERVVILAAGNMATGTQASILALILQKKGKGSSLKNNNFNHHVPAKIVRANKAKVIPSGMYASQTIEEANFRNRITGRYFITGFEFLE